MHPVSRQNSEKKSLLKGLPVWNDKVQMAVSESKQGHLLWKKTGRPSDLNDIYSKSKKTSWCHLQITIRAEVGLKNKAKFDLIMEIQES